MQGRDIAIHGIDAFKGNQFRYFRIFCSQQLFQMLQIIVPEHPFLAAAVLDPGNHRRMIQFVGKDDAARQNLGQCRQRCLIRHIARGEQQGTGLAVPVGQLALELDVIMGVAANIAGSARSRTDIMQSFFHRRDHIGMLAHRQIIVRAPDGYRLRTVVMRETARIGKGTLVSQYVYKDPIAAFCMEPVNRLRKYLVVVHYVTKSCFKSVLAVLLNGLLAPFFLNFQREPLAIR